VEKLAMLEVRGLSVRSPQGWLALDGVTIMAQPGDTVAVVGSNGAGKSTLLQAIAGLERSDRGQVIYRGRSLLGLPPRQRVAAGIVYAPERARILSGLSVLDNLRIGAWLRRDRTAVAADLARLFEWVPALGARRRERADALPVAQRQMLALGRALLSRPGVLLLDETLVGLQEDERTRFAAMLKALSAAETITLLAEQHLLSVRAIAGRAYGLHGGRVVWSGSTAAAEHAGPCARV
jgi:branched-chain amino acid transport system ATP-binding protein